MDILQLQDQIDQMKKHPSDIAKSILGFLECQERRAHPEFSRYVIILESFVESLLFSREGNIREVLLHENWKDIRGGAFTGFLDYWFRSDSEEGDQLKELAPMVLREWVEWSFEKHYFSSQSFRDFYNSLPLNKSQELGRLQKAKNALKMLHSPSIAQEEIFRNVIPINKFQSPNIRLEGYMKLTQVDGNHAYFLSEYKEEIGPVLLSRELNEHLRLGDVLNMGIGKFGKFWKVIDSGNVYSDGAIF